MADNTEHKHPSPSDYYRQDSLTEQRLLQIQEGAKRLPVAEATQIAAITGSPSVDDLETLKLKLVFNRFANRLCNRCYAGKQVVNKHLKLCTGCYSTWYCGRDCQLADRPGMRYRRSKWVGTNEYSDCSVAGETSRLHHSIRTETLSARFGNGSVLPGLRLVVLCSKTPRFRRTAKRHHATLELLHNSFLTLTPTPHFGAIRMRTYHTRLSMTIATRMLTNPSFCLPRPFESNKSLVTRVS